MGWIVLHSSSSIRVVPWFNGPENPAALGLSASGSPDALIGQTRRGWLLIVDDSPDAQAYYAACLASSGYGLVSAANGQEALFQLLDRPLPRAIVLDLLMPEMNGFEFLALLRAYKRLASVPVLIVTAFRSQPEGTGEGDLVLHKPVDRRKLLATLDQLTVPA
jgi:CheY-like chemotaxis protein